MKNYRFFHERTNFPKDLEKLRGFFTEQMIFFKIFFQWDNFIKRTILLRENERNRWKMNDNFENERNHFLDGFSNGERTK